MSFFHKTSFSKFLITTSVTVLLTPFVLAGDYYHPPSESVSDNQVETERSAQVEFEPEPTPNPEDAALSGKEKKKKYNKRSERSRLKKNRNRKITKNCINKMKKKNNRMNRKGKKMSTEEARDLILDCRNKSKNTK